MRYMLTFSYDGRDFFGYQKQLSKRTVQQEIEFCLFKINSNNVVNISATGRTDAKVHAYNQKAHFDLVKEFDLNELKNRMNKMLPNDIYIKNIECVDKSFHARYDVKSKEYIYKINIGEYNPIDRDYVYQYNKYLDIDRMQSALKLFEGEHNFKSFTKVSQENENCNYNRIIYKTNIKLEDDIITIAIEGSGFMRYMVRNMVGLLIDIGSSLKEIEDVIKIIDLEDRTISSKTAPACGLYLYKINY